MEMIVSVPHVWGNVPCIILPALKNGEDPKIWESNNLKWIQKMAMLSKPHDAETA
jgi:hypothetical protein